MRNFVIVACLLSLGVMLPEDAQAQQWKTLATVRVTPGRESETATIRTDRQPFREVRLCVRERLLWISEIRINFTRGRPQATAIRRNIASGACSAAARIRTGHPTIRSITFTHGRVSGTGAPPVVRVQAR